MAEEEKKTEGEEQPASGGKKKLIMIGGGAAALLAVAFVFALMAVPKKPVVHEYAGPFVAPMFVEEVRVNLSGESRKRFAILSLNVVYDAYDEAYYAGRVADPLYGAELKDAVLGIASTKEGREIVDKANKPVFLEEVRQAVEPLLFPVHIGVSKAGDSAPPTDPDKASGLAFGPGPAAFRGRYWDHVLKVDAVAKTIAFNGGPEIAFEGTETALEVPTADERVVFVDVTGLAPEFQGDVQIGVKGKIVKVLWENVLIN